ncbi:MAG: DNA polymerase I [Bacteroidales bacterium]|nr:DNA polymerase I [Bacteroidales bacterium]
MNHPENNSEKLFLIDSYALIYRAYYAMFRHPMFSDSGFNTSTVFGFVNALEDVLNKEHPTHIAAVFDPPGPTFRHKAYAAYKANRPATPEEIRESVPVIQEILAAYRIPVLQVEGYEADDVVGTLARQASAEGITVYMMTPDKDYVQLVGDRVLLYKPRHGGSDIEVLDAAAACAGYGISSPRQMIDLLALMGDASDNVPGAKGIGQKGAVNLLKTYGSVESLLAHVDELKGSIKEKVIESHDNILLSKELVTIKTDVPIQFSADCCRLRTPDYDRLVPLFRKYSFRSFLTRLNERRLAESPDAPPVQAVPGQPRRPRACHTVDTEADCRQLAKRLAGSRDVCFQVVQSSSDVFTADITGLVLTDTGDEVWYVPVPAGRDASARWLAPFKSLFESRDIRKTGYDLKPGIKALALRGIRAGGPLFDVLIAHYLLQPERRHDLFLLASEYLHYEPAKNDYNLDRRTLDTLFSDADTAAPVDCLAEQTAVAAALCPLLETALQQVDMTRLAEEVEMPLIAVLADMELEGVSFSKENMVDFAASLQKEAAELERQVFDWAGTEFNLSSPKQLGEILADRLQLSDRIKKTKTRQMSTSEEVLLTLADKHPVVNTILAYRSVKKLLSTYVEALPQMISPVTGRIHTTFNQAVTATGRLSSADPNLQNIPVREARGREMRKAFVPSHTDSVLLAADYSQIELRLMAAISGDESMLHAFAHDVDIHAMTASKIYNTPLPEVTREMRSKAKTANFGIIYGISAFGLAQRMHIPRSEATTFIADYFRVFPGVHRYMQDAVAEAARQGFVTTLMGRRRYLPDINSRNANVRGMAERNAINAPIQGTAADIIKKAMVTIHRELLARGLRSRMILQVHDELVFDVFLSEKDEVTALVKDAMENAMPLQVPLTVSAGTGTNWLEAHA